MNGAGARQIDEIKKAVVLVAGLGTRLLPATKSQPKEMLPIGRKPGVQYVVEELAAAGIEQVLFITGRAKRSIEDHFDQDDALISKLAQMGRLEAAQQVSVEALGVRFFYTRQGVPLGTADAVLQGREFVGDSTFVVALGDSLIKSARPSALLLRMMASHAAHGASATIAVETVPQHRLARYGVVRPLDEASDDFAVADVVEKPEPEDAPSNLALAGRYIFEPTVFDGIARTLPRSSGEFFLPDSMRLMIVDGQIVRAVRLVGDEKRYDIGNFESYFEAFVDFALEDEEFGEGLREHLSHKLGDWETG